MRSSAAAMRSCIQSSPVARTTSSDSKETDDSASSTRSLAPAEIST